MLFCWGVRDKPQYPAIQSDIASHTSRRSEGNYSGGTFWALPHDIGFAPWLTSVACSAHIKLQKQYCPGGLTCCRGCRSVVLHCAFPINYRHCKAAAGLQIYVSLWGILSTTHVKLAALGSWCDLCARPGGPAGEEEPVHGLPGCAGQGA
jgi:hypothetical protein